MNYSTDHEDAAGAHADLSLVDERAVRGRVDRVVQVGVGEHQQRVQAGKLQKNPLQVRSYCVDADKESGGRALDRGAMNQLDGERCFSASQSPQPAET